MMATDYLPFKITLTDGQEKKLQKAFPARFPFMIMVKANSDLLLS